MVGKSKAFVTIYNGGDTASHSVALPYWNARCFFTLHLKEYERGVKERNHRMLDRRHSKDSSLVLKCRGTCTNIGRPWDHTSANAISIFHVHRFVYNKASLSTPPCFKHDITLNRGCWKVGPITCKIWLLIGLWWVADETYRRKRYNRGSDRVTVIKYMGISSTTLCKIRFLRRDETH